MTIKAIIFDIDGTLVDSNEQHVSAWAFAFREAGYPQEAGDIRRQIGKGGDLLIPALAPDLGDGARRAITEGHGAYFKASYLGNVRAFDGAAALLRAVHDQGRKVVLASSANRDELEHYVALLGVGSIVDASTSVDDVETSKPAPDIFSVALEKVGLDPSEAIVVGDTPYDVEAAARSGLAAIGVTSGPFKESELREAGAISVFAGVASLLREIEHSPIRSGV